jgi:hypothetical protein
MNRFALPAFTKKIECRNSELEIQLSTISIHHSPILYLKSIEYHKSSIFNLQSSFDIPHSYQMLFNHSRFMGQTAVIVVQVALP